MIGRLPQRPSRHCVVATDGGLPSRRRCPARCTSNCHYSSTCSAANYSSHLLPAITTPRTLPGAQQTNKWREIGREVSCDHHKLITAQPHVVNCHRIALPLRALLCGGCAFASSSPDLVDVLLRRCHVNEKLKQTSLSLPADDFH